MKRSFLAAFFVSLTLIVPAIAGDLNTDIGAILNDKLLAKTQVGIRIVRMGETPASVKVVYEHNGNLPLVPASNLKIVTTSAALDALGPDFKFHTILASKGPDLAIIGDGDPTLGDAELLKKVGWDTLTVYNKWADRLKELKINAVRNLLVDDSIFDQVFQNPNWPTNQADRRYMAGVAGLNLNANCVDATVTSNGFGQVVSYTLNPPTRYVTIKNNCVHGNENAIVFSRTPGTNNIVLGGESKGTTQAPVSVNVEDPPLFAGTVLLETLSADGIAFSGNVSRDRTIRAQINSKKGGWNVLAVHETSITVALGRANKDSMNLYAESLGKRLGAEVSHSTGDWKSANAAMAAFMKRVGVAENQYQFDDCCGLSKQNNVTAEALSRVLTYDFYSPNHQAFFSSLAIAGFDGTLDDRFRGSDLRGRVFAKSGFVEGVSALSGYFKAKDDQWYAFSILMNGIPAKSNSSYKQLQEKIVTAVDLSVKR